MICPLIVWRPITFQQARVGQTAETLSLGFSKAGRLEGILATEGIPVEAYIKAGSPIFFLFFNFSTPIAQWPSLISSTSPFPKSTLRTI